MSTLQTPEAAELRTGAAESASACDGASGPSARFTAWGTIAVAAAAMVGTLPGRTHGLGLVTEPLLADLSLTKVEFGQINLWATLIGALACFPAGRLLDRYGLRSVLCGTALLLGATVWGMSGAATAGTLFVFVTLTRAFGQSALSVVSIAVVGKSFDRRLNWPMAAYSVLMSIGFMTAFPLVGSCVAKYGWRHAWAGIGAALLVVLAPSAWLLPRRPPELREETDPAVGHGFTLAAALRTPAFWIFAAATSLFGLASSGLGLYNAAVLAERGFDYATYYKTLAVSAPLGLLGQAACARLARRWSYQSLTAGAMVLYAVALILLTRVTTWPELMSAVAILGVSGGMITVIFFAVWPRLFGRRELGRIQGAAQMLTVLASAVGPLVFAGFWARTGSYAPVLFATACVVVAVGAAAVFVASPVLPSENA